MKVVKKKLEDLQRPERNIRMHTDKQIAEFRRSHSNVRANPTYCH